MNFLILKYLYYTQSLFIPLKGLNTMVKKKSNYTCNLVTNAKKIELEYDKNSDKKKINIIEFLAWVWVDDTLLQDELVKNGYAEVAYLYGDYKYTNTLKDHQAVAAKPLK